jgi:hypothetical protein
MLQEIVFTGNKYFKDFQQPFSIVVTKDVNAMFVQ